MAVALGITVWVGGAQRPGITRRALPPTPAPSPSEPQFPICGNEKGTPKLGWSPEIQSWAHARCVRHCPALCMSASVPNTSSSIPLTKPVPPSPDILQWGNGVPGSDLAGPRPTLVASERALDPFPDEPSHLPGKGAALCPLGHHHSDVSPWWFPCSLSSGACPVPCTGPQRDHSCWNRHKTG